MVNTNNKEKQQKKRADKYDEKLKTEKSFDQLLKIAAKPPKKKSEEEE